MSALMLSPSTLPPGSIVWDYLRDSGGNAQEMSISQQAQEGVMPPLCRLNDIHFLIP